MARAPRPDAALFETLLRTARNVCAENGVRCHVGRNFSIDCIFPQYAHIDEILAMGVNTIEMETAAAFAAARVAGLPCAGAVQRVRQHRLRQVAGQRAHGGRESVPAIRQEGAVPADSAQRA